SKSSSNTSGTRWSSITRPPARGPNAHREYRVSLTSGMPISAANISTSMVPSARRTSRRSGTQMSFWHAPSGLSSHPVRIVTSWGVRWSFPSSANEDDTRVGRGLPPGPAGRKNGWMPYDSLAEVPYDYAAVAPAGATLFTAGACPLDGEGRVVGAADYR